MKGKPILFSNHNETAVSQGLRKTIMRNFTKHLITDMKFSPLLIYMIVISID